MKVLRKIIEIDEEFCNGCGECVPDCAEGALEIIDGKAKMIADKYCDGLGACLGSCPVGALKIVEREADDFDEAAVEKLLQERKQKEKAAGPVSQGCGCPSGRLFHFQPGKPFQAVHHQPGKERRPAASASALSHWPVQIRLVPPAAPFLKNADLLVTADCAPLAYPAFHSDFLQGKAVLMGCPKFDDAQGYIAKFVEVFDTAAPRSITIAIMEVPCCSAMNTIIKEALKRSDRQIPVEQIVIGVRGDILARESW